MNTQDNQVAPVPHMLQNLVTEHVMDTAGYLHEVLRYNRTDADSMHDWPRMLMYRITDAEATLHVLAGTLAMYLREVEGRSGDVLGRYLQVPEAEVESRISEQARECFAGLVGKDYDGGFVWYAEGKNIAAGESDYPQNHRDGLEACLTAMWSDIADDPGVLARLPESLRELVLRIHATLSEEPVSV